MNRFEIADALTSLIEEIHRPDPVQKVPLESVLAARKSTPYFNTTLDEPAPIDPDAQISPRLRPRFDDLHTPSKAQIPIDQKTFGSVESRLVGICDRINAAAGALDEQTIAIAGVPVCGEGSNAKGVPTPDTVVGRLHNLMDHLDAVLSHIEGNVARLNGVTAINA